MTGGLRDVIARNRAGQAAMIPGTGSAAITAMHGRLPNNGILPGPTASAVAGPEPGPRAQLLLASILDAPRAYFFAEQPLEAQHVA